MALKPLFSLIFALFLFSCSFEQEEQINYEAEFNSIVSEFEKSSILSFEKKNIDRNTFTKEFILKLDKQKNIFLQEDFYSLIDNANKKPELDYQLLKEIVELYYKRYEESLEMRSEYLNSHKFNFNVKEEINLKSRDAFF